MNLDLIEGKIKIIKANIRILEKSLLKNNDSKIKDKLQKEQRDLEELKKLYPALFI